MDEEFLTELKALIPELLKPENLVVKKLNGVPMTAEDLNRNLKEFVKLFQSSSLPRAQSIFESTVESFLTNLVEEEFEFFQSLVGSPRSVQEAENLFSFAKTRALSAFDYKKKMGTRKHFDKFRKVLEVKITSYSLELKAKLQAEISKSSESARKAEEARAEAEKLRKKKEDEEKKAREHAAQLEAEAKQREAEAARKREELRQKELEIQAAIERQRIAEEQKQREISEQQRLEEERRRAEEDRRRREEEERRKTWFKIEAGPHVNVDVPKPKCVLM